MFIFNTRCMNFLFSLCGLHWESCVCVCVRANGLVSGVKQTTWELFLGISVCSPSLCLSLCVCVCDIWHWPSEGGTVVSLSKLHEREPRSPDELKPLFNKTSESFSNTRLRCPSNWLLDFRIYMNPPKAAYLCSDAPWVRSRSSPMRISINSRSLLIRLCSSDVINEKLPTVDNLEDLLSVWINLFWPKTNPENESESK